VTRTRESHAIAGWMQAVLESDEALLAEVLRLGVQSLMEAERDAAAKDSGSDFYIHAALPETLEVPNQSRAVRNRGVRTDDAANVAGG